MIFEKIKKALIPPAFQEVKSKSAKTKPVKASRVVLAKKEKPVERQSKAAISKPFGFLQLFLLVLAFGFAVKGQLEWLNVSEKTVGIGAFYYLLGIICFLSVFRPFQIESASTQALPIRFEIFFFTVILLVGAFFRLYRLDFMPPGLFWDQGYEGLYSLKILHEHFRPLLEFFEFKNPALLLYQLAGWFIFFSPGQVNFYLFFGLLSLATFPLVYWTFRQLAGPRTALLALYILAVMRWNINFSRNGFPTIQVPFYLFGTLAFLLYGLKSQKRWPFWVSGVFYSMGCYTYQAYKVTPLVLFTFLTYEYLTNRAGFKLNLKRILGFFLIIFILTSPLLHEYFGKTGFGMWREQNYNIVSEMNEQHSWAPLVDMVSRTALMFNRAGDVNERHNYPNYRMLDDVTGFLFILGLAFSLSRVTQRKYFYAATGFFIMCLPCLLSTDPAHANRMLGTTPFIALLAAVPLAAIFDKLGRKWGWPGEIALFLLLIQPFVLMAGINYHNYFVMQASNNSIYDIGIWNGYSYVDTRIGELIQKEGPANDFYLAPRFYNYPTIEFLTYFHPEYAKKFEFPKDIPPFMTTPGRGIYFCVVGLHTGELDYLQKIYPTGQLDKIKDLDGNVLAYIYKVPPDALASAKGLTGQFQDSKTTFSDFPNGLPAGPRHLKLSGNVFVDQPGKYHFVAAGNCKTTCAIGGHLFRKGKETELARGFYSISLDMSLPEGKADPKLALANEKGVQQPLDSSSLTPLGLNHGLQGTYYNNTEEQGTPLFTQWSPILNFPFGVDFPYANHPLFIHWKGILHAPKTGSYEFTAKTEEETSVVVDGRAALPWTDPLKPSAPKIGLVTLTKGDHAFDVYFRKVLGPTYSLLWKTPDAAAPSVIPAEAFGTTH